MLSSAQRLRRRADFTATVRGGRRAARGAVVVHVKLTEPVQPGDEAPPARAGFVVSRAVGGAVERNLVKRRLRHLVRPRLVELPAGATVVVRALAGAATRSYADLDADLAAALARATGSRSRR